MLPAFSGECDSGLKMEVPLQPGWEDRVKLKLGWTGEHSAAAHSNSWS